jgi:hypothetical protein
MARLRFVRCRFVGGPFDGLSVRWPAPWAAALLDTVHRERLHLYRLDGEVSRWSRAGRLVRAVYRHVPEGVANARETL